MKILSKLLCLVGSHDWRNGPGSDCAECGVPDRIYKPSKKLLKLSEQWMLEHWGPRCDSTCNYCSLCFAWAMYDDLFNQGESAKTVETEFQDCTVKMQHSAFTHHLVASRVIGWMEHRKCFTGECIQQCDRCSSEAVNLVSEIADDILKAKVEYRS